MIRVHLPRDLAEEFGAAATLALDPEPDVAAVIDRLECLFPGVRQRLVEADGQLRPHLAVFVGEADARRAGGAAAAVPDGAEIWVLRAVSGG